MLKRYLIGGGVVALVVGGLLYALPTEKVVRPGVTQDTSALVQQDPIAHYAQRLSAEFDGRITQLEAQLELKAFWDYLRQTYPQRQGMFKQVLMRAFPGEWQDVMSLLLALAEYDAWLLDNMSQLNALNPLAYQAALWDKRRALLGNKADEVWAKETKRSHVRRENLQQAVTVLDTAYEVEIHERLTLLTGAIEANYGDQRQGQLISKGMVAQTFFSLTSVQRDLAALSHASRQKQIDDIRFLLGFSQEQVASMAAQDQRKEQAWQQGYAYMRDREALAQDETALAALRQRYFGDNAHTIAKEEASGFYRFSRPRVYGRN